MKLNWGFGIATLYTAFALGMIGMVVLASRQKNDLVTDGYYEQAVHFQDKINAETNALEANNFDLKYLNDERKAVVRFTDNISVHGNLQFYKPDDAGKDFSVTLQTNNEGKQEIALPQIAHGYWNVLASWQNNSKEYFKEVRIYVH
ncbi:MAG: FixH family protein [Bacteroidetes bacterium]|jgi:hypothetical protein|nr:FixH family protein [Bacteroidota bacterium]